jgi:hypothetical protein
MPSSAVQMSSEPSIRPGPGLVRPPQKGTLAWLMVVVAVAFAYLYTSLFSLAGGTPRLRGGDEDFFWTYASRLLAGQVFLRDFHQFTPPGTDLVYAAVFRAFGANLRSIDWTILWLGMALAVVCFACARRILRAKPAALAALACVAVLYGDRMDATHHWFSSLANLLAVLLLMRGRSWARIAGAAALIAIAAFFTQTAGAVGLLACSAGLVWEMRAGRISPGMLRAQMAAMGGITLGVWLLLSGRFIVHAGIERYWFAQVAYLPRDGNFPVGFLVPHFSASLHVRSLIALGDHVVVYILLLGVCPWVARWCRRRRVEGGENAFALVLLAALGILETLEVITVLNWNRMAAVAMPAMILGVWLLTRVRTAGRPWVVACACVVGGMMVVQSGATQMRHFPRLTLPAGDVLLEPDDVEEWMWLAAHTRPGDSIFEAGNTRLYVPLGLRNPTTVDVLSASNATLPQWVEETVEGLKQGASRYILWEPRTGIGLVEQRHKANSDHLDPLRGYMREQYVRVAVFANGDQVWERRY